MSGEGSNTATGSAGNPEALTRGVAVLALVAVLAGGVVWAWISDAAAMREDVEVAWAGPVTCTGTKVVWERMGLGEPGLVRVIRLRGSMDCKLPVRITNHGRGRVRIRQVRLPSMGPEARAAVRVAQLEGRRPLRNHHDAVFPMDRPLEPGNSYDFTIEFGFRAPPEGCTASGFMWVRGMPTVVLTALGRTGTLASKRTIVFAGTRGSEC